MSTVAYCTSVNVYVGLCFCNSQLMPGGEVCPVAQFSSSARKQSRHPTKRKALT